MAGLVRSRRNRTERKLWKEMTPDPFFGPDVGQRPFLEIGGVVNLVADRREFRLCFCLGGDAPDLLERPQVDGEAEMFVAAPHRTPVRVVAERGRAVDVSPDALAVGMEEMRALGVDDDSIDALAEAVAADVGTLFDDQAVLSGISHVPSEDCAEHARTHNHIVEHGPFPIRELGRSSLFCPFQCGDIVTAKQVWP